jgi:transcriptional regulator with XRE-family HTH domain
MENNFKHRFSAFRKLYKLSQNSIAEQLGVSQGIISQYENGKAVPESDVQRKIAKAFPKLSMDWLMYGEGQMNMYLIDLTAEEPEEIIPCHERLTKLESKITTLFEAITNLQNQLIQPQ